ncbi:MAG TPA: CsbD family protein [Acidimicrobiales bacterium]|nr:CsbD family protein [Acidimicrobiales bacterium]
MAGKTDQVKGQVKEAVGTLTGDKDLESEGKADRRAGEAKEKLSDAKDKVEEVIDKAEEKVEEVVDKAREALHRK